MFLKPGQIIRFTYMHQVRDAETGDRYKEVLVLHPHWAGKVHGIDLKRLSPAERQVLEIVMSWDWRKHKSDRYEEHPNPLVADIMRRMPQPKREVKNPKIFYYKFVKPFLNKRDAYRTYYPGQMTGVSVIKDAEISTGKPKNDKPLFPPKKQEPETPAKQATLSPAQARLAALKARAGGAKPAQPATPAAPAAPARPPMAAQSALKPLPTGVAKTGVAGSSAGGSAASRLAALKAKAGIKK